MPARVGPRDRVAAHATIKVGVARRKAPRVAAGERAQPGVIPTGAIVVQARLRVEFPAGEENRIVVGRRAANVRPRRVVDRHIAVRRVDVSLDHIAGSIRQRRDVGVGVGQVIDPRGRSLIINCQRTTRLSLTIPPMWQFTKLAASSLFRLPELSNKIPVNIIR